ncbi:DUF1971 domain-containing protein [Sphingomonas crocodyli]|uniref:DUF1971 domain-containing protein n=1 Tax=Sphingomonas crocodyli TaxID=1979270 RepID=A0A437LZR0_9SPHN|nr:DUF1971 domain-containing protein [Sphingomonas crocodyli]RVT90919.1 DUF1971 domain-containing protein [Sphingomonas crocodyli]
MAQIEKAATQRHIPGSDTAPPSQPYRSSPVFTEATLPLALQHDHRTKRGVWGVIRVLEGALLYCLEDGSPPRILLPGRPGIVRPDEPHHVELMGPMRMRVDFFDHEPTLLEDG